METPAAKPTAGLVFSFRAEPLRAAIQDLTQTYGARYPRGAEFANRLEKLETARAAALAGWSSGAAGSEPALARAVAELDASCFVVDYWANPTTAIYRATLPAFIDVLRAKHPATPILVTGPYYNPSEDVPGEAGQRQIEKRAFGREFVAARRAAGDRRIVWVDGLEMIARDQADGLVDGRHGNSMGYYLCARGLEPHLRTALGLPARRDAR